MLTRAADDGCFSWVYIATEEKGGRDLPNGAAKPEKSPRAKAQDEERDTQMDQHITRGKQYASLIVAAAIFQPKTQKILLLKRSPAEKLFAHHWEIPGGKVDDTDVTIGDALKREVNEETGLVIKESNITYAEEGFEWPLGENVTDDPEMALELNFIIERQEFPEAVKLDPEEHMESLWADETDIMGLKMTPEMRNVVEHGFAVLRLRRREAWIRIIAELDTLPKEKN